MGFGAEQQIIIDVVEPASSNSGWIVPICAALISAVGGVVAVIVGKRRSKRKK